MTDNDRSLRINAYYAIEKIACDVLIIPRQGISPGDKRMYAIRVDPHDPESVLEALRVATCSENAELRAVAIREIRELATRNRHLVPRSIMILLDDVNDKDSSVRAAAISVLRLDLQAIRDVRPALVQYLNDASAELRLEAAKALVDLGAEALDILVTACSSDDDDVRRLAIYGIGRNG